MLVWNLSGRGRGATQVQVQEARRLAHSIEDAWDIFDPFILTNIFRHWVNLISPIGKYESINNSAEMKWRINSVQDYNKTSDVKILVYYFY